MKRDVLKEADLQTQQDNLPQIDRVCGVLPAGTEIGESNMRRASELKTRRDDGPVQLHNRTQLRFDAKLHHAGRQCSPIEDPPPAVGKRHEKSRQQAGAVVVTEALNIERLHEESSDLVRSGFACLSFFIGGAGLKRDRGRGTVVM